MIRRRTETVPFYSCGRVAGYDTIFRDPEPFPEKYIIEGKHEIVDFHKLTRIRYTDQCEMVEKWIQQEPNNVIAIRKESKEIFNLLFYITIPLKHLEIVVNNAKYDLSYLYTEKMRKQLNICEAHEEYLLKEIMYANISPNNYTKKSYDKYIMDITKETDVLLDAIYKLIMHDKKKEQDVDLIIQYYIICYPILRLTQELYFNVLFNQYVLWLYRRKDVQSATYYYIIRHFNLVFKQKDKSLTEMFIRGFEHILYSSFISPDLGLSFNHKLRLYKFIVYLKIYSKITSDPDIMLEFNKNGVIVPENGNHSLLYDSINKKYFHKFWGKNAILSEYLTTDKIVFKKTEKEKKAEYLRYLEIENNNKDFLKKEIERIKPLATGFIPDKKHDH